jgi:RNA polymerase sigma-70 factor (ECF subfamily)
VLTRRLVAGDEKAYRMFYEAYFDRLSRYLLVVAAGDEHAMREALQEALTRIVRHIRVFTDEAVFWSWLSVLARSSLFDAGRKRRRYRMFLERFARHTVTVESTAEDTARDRDRLGDLLQASLALLPAGERQLVEWKYFDRRSVREIAAIIQTTEKAVESQLVRIRRKLKQSVLAHLHDESSA